MACFWIGILQSLTEDDLSKIGAKRTPESVREALKNHNVLTKNVLWQGSELTEQQLNENFTAVKEHNGNVHDGYLCSTFDPFLFLIGELFELEIRHRYLNCTVEYKHRSASRSIRFTSNSGHFTYSK